MTTTVRTHSIDLAACAHCAGRITKTPVPYGFRWLHVGGGIACSGQPAGVITTATPRRPAVASR